VVDPAYDMNHECAPPGRLSVDTVTDDHTSAAALAAGPSACSETALANVSSADTADTLHRTRVTLRAVDFGGQREYLYTHRLFCTSRAVYAVCVALDEWYGAEMEHVVPALHDYVSMVKLRAPEAPVVLVFTKADAVPSVSPGSIPKVLSDWASGVAHALHSDCPQLSIGPSSDEPQYLVVSSQDGWEECHAHLCQRLASLALASPGVGDVLPHSYGALRDALVAAGSGWKQVSDDTPAAETDGMEEHKGVDAATSNIVSSAEQHGVALRMQWRADVPIAAVSAVRDLAIHHCGLSPDADMHQVLLLLHSMGAIVYGGALCKPVPRHHGMEHPIHLSQLVVLDAQWLADMLSRVVAQSTKRRDDAGRSSPGSVSPVDVVSAFHGYPDDLQGSFVEVLLALDIAFPGMKNDGSAAEHLVIPTLV